MLVQAALRSIGANWWPIAFVALGVVGNTRAWAQADKPVATVNGEPITVNDLYRRLLRVKGSDFLVPTNPPTIRQENAGYLVLNSLINERLILQCAAKNNLSPTDAEVKADLDPVLKQDAVVNAIKEHTVTADDLKYDLSVQVARFNLATERKPVSAQEVEKFYNDHAEMFKIPERWGISAIRTKEPGDAVKVITDLRAGTTFEEAARTYSSDERSRATGGRIGVVDAGDKNLPDSIRTAVNALKVGDYTQPIIVPFDAGDGTGKQSVYWIVKLNSRTASVTKQLADVRKQVERLTALQKSGGLEKADDKVAEFRKSSDVKVYLPGSEALGSAPK